jgi:hypothetical protein
LKRTKKSPDFMTLLVIFAQDLVNWHCMPDEFALFEMALNKRGRLWRWHICTIAGAVVMRGSERNRRAAKYQADRALFMLLLSAPYRSIGLSNPERVGDGRLAQRCSRASPLTYPFDALRNQAGPAKSA